MQTSSTGHTPNPFNVFNQPPLLADYNIYEQDTALREAVQREGGGWVEEQARAFGAVMGRAETLRLGDLANRYPPVLHTFDRFGHRIDEVEYHPAYHDLMRLGVEQQTHALPWACDRPGAHVARVALGFIRHQVEEGTSCPLTMTYAAVPTLRLQPELAAEWEPRVTTTTYDPRFIPAGQKRGAIFGMAMTERQGGSDVRANTTYAVPIGQGGPGAEYLITGHKWFCSAPMSDAFLVLAQAPRGLACFLLPRWTPDGARNAFRINRLKDKVGNRSNASSEVEFHEAWARLVGEEGRGVATIIEMVRHTRLDCAWGSAASIRRTAAEATHHAAFRSAFGRRLADQPLMQNVLADLCLESEAATALVMRLARGFDQSPHNEQEARLTRLATPITKYWVTKRNPAVAVEALECTGGNGFVEEGPMGRLFRDSPLNSLWEGAGNVQCLDALRAAHKEPSSIAAVLDEIGLAAGGNRWLDQHLARLERELSNPDQLEARARRLVEGLALGLQASLLVRFAPAYVADAFCAARLGGEGGLAFGTLPSGTDFTSIIQRARPKLDM